VVSSLEAFSTKILYALLISLVHATRSLNHILIYLIVQPVLGEVYNFMKFLIM
jgi:hypothetical protein